MLSFIGQTNQSQLTQLADDNSRLREQNRLLLQRLDEALNEIALLKEENQRLKDEIAILKKQKPRPKIPPNILEGRNSSSKSGPEKTTRGKHPRRQKINTLVIHETVRLKPESIPEGAVFKGTQKYTVQDVRIQNFNVVYERERWQLPDGTYVTAELPKGVDGHYGPELRAFILHQHYACRVTEPLLLQSLRLIGVLISSGQLSRLLIEAKEDFHQEKQEILVAGIEATGQIQVDDIGARHAGKSAYTTVIGNSLFAFFSTNPSKSRVNFLQVLHGGEPKYLLNDDAWAYIYEQNPRSKLPGFLKDCPQDAMKQESFAAYLNKAGIKTKGMVRLATQAALFASLIEQGIPRDLQIHADDAGQFAVFIYSLCWIHEERHYRKFQVYQAETEEAIQQVRGQIWELYNGLKAYKESPSESERNRLEQEFDKVFLQKTSSSLLNERLALSYAKKERLLMVLDNPSTSLHNNATETDGRAGVVAKKVSGGTRSEAGKKARDTFLSLKQTTRKLGINFYEYLKDRLSGQNNIPRLSSIIRAGSVQPAAP